MDTIEIRPFGGGWQCYESEGVAPYFTEGDAKRMATDYAVARMAGRSGEIRVLDKSGNVERILPFTK